MLCEGCCFCHAKDRHLEFGICEGLFAYKDSITHKTVLGLGLGLG